MSVGPKLGRTVLSLVSENKMALHDVKEALVALGRIVLLEATVRHDLFFENRRLNHLFHKISVKSFSFGSLTIPAMVPYKLLRNLSICSSPSPHHATAVRSVML